MATYAQCVMWRTICGLLVLRAVWSVKSCSGIPSAPFTQSACSLEADSTGRSLFKGAVPDPFALSRQYLDNRERWPHSASLSTVHRHLRYFFEQERLPKRYAHILWKRIQPQDGVESLRCLVDDLERSCGNLGSDSGDPLS